MSIASEIQRIQTNINNIYDVLEDRGAIIPSTRNSSNLSVAINGYNTVLRKPLNCRQLILWLDGDCNTRDGLDRTKKYMENLVWNRPFTNQVGNFEYVSPNSSDNTWNENFLIYKGTYTGLLPNIFQNSTWTLEVVVKTFSSSTWTSNSCNFYQCLPNNNGSALFTTHSGQIILAYFKTNTGSELQYLGTPSTSVQTDVAYYGCFTNNNGTLRGIVPAINFDVSVTNYVKVNVDFNVGMFNSGSKTAFTPGSSFSTNDKSSGLGMLRGWSRVLSDAEIQANYADAKARFNCV